MQKEHIKKSPLGGIEGFSPEESRGRGLLTFTILSISLLTVMAGAAVAPALGIIQQHFSSAPSLLIKLIVSMPALFIIIVNLCFAQLCKYMRTKTIALVGLIMYVVCGMGAFFAEDIVTLLILRALLGVSVGMIMPLSTGLLAYYFPPEKMSQLMGLSAAMNQMGGVVATMLAGLLATVEWNYAFLVYGLGLIAVILVLLYLPNEKLHPGRSYKKEAHNVMPGIDDSEAYAEAHTAGTWILLRRFHPSILGMFLCMCIFFVFVTNFAITETGRFTSMEVTNLMVGTDIVAFLVGMVFGKIMGVMPLQMKYIAPLTFLVGYMLIAFVPQTLTVIIGCACIGAANGVGIPYLNTIASIKGGRDSITTVMPLISAALYVGQFLSPMIVNSLSAIAFGDDNRGPYKVAVVLAVVYLLQVVATRKFQSLPPREH